MIMDAIQQSDRYLALTDYEARYVTDHGMKAELVSIVGAGVDPAPYQASSAQETKGRLGSADRVVVGYIGQLVAHKGVDLLLRAMPLVWSKMPEICLLVAGSSTRYAQKLKEICTGWPAEYRDSSPGSRISQKTTKQVYMQHWMSSFIHRCTNCSE